LKVFYDLKDQFIAKIQTNSLQTSNLNDRGRYLAYNIVDS